MGAMRRSGWRGALLAGLTMVAVPALAQSVSDTRKSADRMAADIVGKLTLDEKLDQLLNVAPAIPRLNIPDYNWWTESLHGALGSVETTNFPEPIGLAATFDAPLIRNVAGAISMEVRGLHSLARRTGKVGRIGTGLDTWSPNINIFRDPRWGRGQETYGEDPHLAARLGVAFVEGMQGPNPDLPNVVATPKHFAVHSGPESTRHGANVFVSPHDLEDTYLPAFRAAVVEGKAGSIMCAYNRIDGQPACASDLLLKDHLREAWGFTGYVVSDCDAVKDVADNHKYAPDAATAAAAALRAGVDSECNGETLGDAAGLGERYREALKRGLISTGDIDRALTRLFSARIRNGDLPGIRRNTVTPAAVGAPEHGKLALEAAEKSLVLLKNDGLLPLRPGVRVAVIGPLGDATRVLRGNYSSPLSTAPVSVLEGLRQVMPAGSVTHAPFAPTFTDGDRIPQSALRAADGAPGLTAKYYNATTTPPRYFQPGTSRKIIQALKYASTPVVTRREPDVGGRGLSLKEVTPYHQVVWTGSLVAPETGTYRLGMNGTDGEMLFQGKPFVDLTKSQWNSLPTMKTVELVKGKRYPIQITSRGHGNAGAGLVWKRVTNTPDQALTSAAANADVLVAVVGLTADLETEESPVAVPGFEHGDKTTLDLPADQLAMLEKAKATGKPLIVVAMNGSPVNLAWGKDNASAVVEAWYPGQAGGLAVANVLSGRTNPSGRLPLTFYRSLSDLPPFGDYDMQGRTYRYFSGTPVYSFGYGLSYTSFAYAPVKVDAARGGAHNGIRVTTEVRNTGSRAGDEVAQLYLNFPNEPGVPQVALRGFQRVTLKPGEARKISFDLNPRDLSSVALDGTRRVLKGGYRITVGSGQPGTGVAGETTTFDVNETEVLPK